ncbi:metal ABC transporter permease [bacterium]|nr:metal ABC transporter permease [bacterium]
MNQFILSLITGILIGAVSGYLGTLMLSKRMTLVAGPLGHLTLPGIALALIYGFDVSLGAFPFVILGIVLIWILEIWTKLPMEALTAIVFSLGVAIAFLFLPIEQAKTALIGDITKVGVYETIITVTLCSLIFFVIRKIYAKMILINISEDLAKTSEIDIKKYNILYLLAIAIIVALGVKMVGGLLTAALVAIPASASRNLSKNLFQYTSLATFFGAISSFLGILIFKFTALPAGPSIIIINSLIFLVSIIFKR